MNSRVITTAATARAKLSAFTAPWDEQTGRTGVLMLTNGIQVSQRRIGSDLHEAIAEHHHQ